MGDDFEFVDLERERMEELTKAVDVICGSVTRDGQNGGPFHMACFVWNRLYNDKDVVGTYKLDGPPRLSGKNTFFDLEPNPSHRFKDKKYNLIRVVFNHFGDGKNGPIASFVFEDKDHAVDAAEHKNIQELIKWLLDLCIQAERDMIPLFTD